MPCKEWSNTLEYGLSLRMDTHIKDQGSGESIPISVFRHAKPMIAKYRPQTGDFNTKERCVFQKHYAGKTFFEIKHIQTVLDGTVGPRQDDSYQLVFEVRRDGKAHPQAYSRAPAIGGYRNWQEGRSLAVRIELEYLPRYGNWKFRYMFHRETFAFQSNDQMGSHMGFIKNIALIKGLFHASPTKLQP